MNSNPADSTLLIPTIKLGTLSIPTSPSSETSSPSAISNLDLDSMLDKLVHEMTDEELTEYVKRCNLLSSSAQTRKAVLVKEGTGHGAVRKPKKKDSVQEALDLLMASAAPKK